jgi:hypothetical protein
VGREAVLGDFAVKALTTRPAIGRSVGGRLAIAGAAALASLILSSQARAEIRNIDGYPVKLADVTHDVAAQVPDYGITTSDVLPILKEENASGDSAKAMALPRPISHGGGSEVDSVVWSKSGPLVVAQSALTYHYIIVGPKAGVVTLDVKGFLALAPGSGSGYAEEDAQILVGTPLDGLNLFANCTTNGPACRTQEVTGKVKAYAVDDTLLSLGLDGGPDLNTVTLSATALAIYGAGAEAFADPMLAVDPSTPDAADYRIYFNTGISNVTGGVPEPGTWALLIAGFTLAGLPLRRRRTAPVLAGA